MKTEKCEIDGCENEGEYYDPEDRFVCSGHLENYYKYELGIMKNENQKINSAPD
jgi:hypothetical protein